MAGPVIVFPGGLVILGVSIAMIVIGAQNLEACENDGAIYLVVTGSFVLGFPFLAGLGFACSPIIGAFLGGVGLIAKLAIQIWGSITVFGSYADWTSDDANAGQENFCPETPFMFSFVWLIIVWSLIPLACCLAACGLAG